MRAMNGEAENRLPGGGKPPMDCIEAGDMPPLRRGRLGPVEMERELRRQRQRSLSFDSAGEPYLETAGVPDTLARQLRTPLTPQRPYVGDAELVVASDPFGAPADAFRDLAIQLAGKAVDRKTKVALAIVSPDRRDGKSYVAANLAACLGRLGGRTVLVDADLRAPRLHRLLDVEDGEGLASILRGEGRASLVQAVPQVPGLFFLPAGQVPPNPVELLQSPRFHLLVFELLLAFDHVVIDTPADRWGPDARLVAATAGAALVVGRQGGSTLASLRELLGRIGRQQVEIAGMVMNRHDD